jgi:hypothetical protein
MNGRPATVNQKRDREKELKEILLQIESAIKYIFLENVSAKRSTNYLGLLSIKYLSYFKKGL